VRSFSRQGPRSCCKARCLCSRLLFPRE